MVLKVAFAAVCLAFAGARPVQAAGTVVIDPTTTHQTMAGWEATAWASQESPAFPNFKDALFDQAVDDVGINRLRLEVRSGTENSQDYWTQYQTGAIDYATWRSLRYSTVNDNDDPGVIDWSGFHFSELDDAVERVVIPFKQRVEANGEHLYINLNYVAFTSQIGAGLLYQHDDPEEYAEFILAALLHIRNQYGWSPDAVEVILEPDNVAQWNGALVGQAIVACAAKLTANAFTTRFIAPSNTNMGNAITYFDQLIQVPDALGSLSELSYHRYGGVSDANLQAIAARAEQHGIGASMLEWWSEGNGYQILHQDLKEGRNSAWQRWRWRGRSTRSRPLGPWTRSGPSSGPSCERSSSTHNRGLGRRTSTRCPRSTETPHQIPVPEPDTNLRPRIRTQRGLRGHQMRCLLFDYGTMTPDTHRKEPPLRGTVLL